MRSAVLYDPIVLQFPPCIVAAHASLYQASIPLDLGGLFGDAQFFWSRWRDPSIDLFWWVGKSRGMDVAMGMVTRVGLSLYTPPSGRLGILDSALKPRRGNAGGVISGIPDRECPELLELQVEQPAVLLVNGTPVQGAKLEYTGGHRSHKA
jgi:hypothetical protein